MAKTRRWEGGGGFPKVVLLMPESDSSLSWCVFLLSGKCKKKN